MSDQTKSYCSHLDGYSVVTFRKELCKAPLDEIRAAGEQIVSDLAHQKTPQCLVDLTDLDYMGSSMVASIVRIWKSIEANQGRMVVAVSGIGVREVLRVTGLERVWTIRTSYESALHELGFSSQAKIVKRELRLLAFVGPATLVVGGIAAALCRVPALAALSQPPDWVPYSLVAVAVITSCISIFREHSWRRWLSVIVFLVASSLLGWLIWTEEPTETESSSREREKGEAVESGDTQEGSEESSKPSNKRTQPLDNKSTEETSDSQQDKPPIASPPITSGAPAPFDDSVTSKPVPEGSPSNSNNNPPVPQPTTSSVSPAAKSAPASDPPPQP